MALLQLTPKKALADLKRSGLICISIFLLTIASKTASAVTTYTWAGTTDTKWSTNSNWLPSTGHPVAGDIVQIGSTANKPTVDVTSACASVTITATTTLTLSAVLTVSTGLTVNGGANLTFAGASNATFGGSSSVGNPSTLTIGSSNTITFNAALAINAGGTLINNGNLKSNSATGITTGNPGTLTNNSSGIITLTASTLNVGGGTTMINSGQIIANSASSIITNNPVTFTNSSGASITLTGSTLSFGGGTNVSNSGAITANASSTVNTSNPCPVTNSSTGTITLSASAWNLGGGSYISNSGAVAINAASTVTFSNPSYIDNATAASTLTVSASTLDIGGGGYITNSGTLTTSAVSTVKINGNPAYITNNVGRTFSATSTTFTMVAGTQLTNTGGTFNLTSCSISCSGNPTIITNQNNSATTGTMTLDATPINFTGTNSLINYGTLTAKNVSPITLSGTTSTSSIINYGTFYAGLSNSSANITLLGNSPSLTNGISGSNTGVFYLGSTSILYPTSTNCSVTNSATCTFTLQSDAFGSAAIGAIPAGANPSPSITGTYNVERYFQGSTTQTTRWVERNYRIISSPVNTGSLVGGNYISALNYIVGATAGLTTTASSTTNSFVTGAAGGSTSAGNPSLYLYREDKVPSNTTFTSGNFRGITNITTPSAMSTSDAGSWNIPVGNGVFFFFRGNATNYTARTTGSYVAPENTTLTSSGTINQGQIVVKDWFTPASATLSYTSATANSAVRGYNMVGNPYPCSIDWNTYFSGGITTTNILPTIYVFNPVTNQYDTYITTSSSAGTGTGNATSIIASGQGFFVRGTLPGSPALTFNETAKSAASQLTNSSLLMGKPVDKTAVLQQLRLKLVMDSLSYNDIVIGFNSSASEKYNGMEDAEYLPGNAPPVTLTSLSADKVKLAINFLPLPNLQKRVINLYVGATNSGQYTLKQTGISAIPEIYEIWLMDNFKKDSLDIRHNQNYVFNIDKSDTSTYGSNRFQLVIRQKTSLAVHLLDFAAIKATDGVQTTWKTENEQNYTNFTIERSNDNGQTYNVIGGLLSTAAATYSLPDKNPANGVNQYRLEIEDLNGDISYSKVIALDYTNSGNSAAVSNINVYPNPASNTLNLAIGANNKLNTNSAGSYVNNPATFGGLTSTAKFNSAANLGVNQSSATGSYAIKIVNSSGAVIKTAFSKDVNWQTDVSHLLPGTYVIQVTNNTDKTIVGKSIFVKL